MGRSRPICIERLDGGARASCVEDVLKTNTHAGRQDTPPQPTQRCGELPARALRAKENAIVASSQRGGAALAAQSSPESGYAGALARSGNG